MNSSQLDPLLQLAKCEMCPKKVTNFVAGLCDRCVTIWMTRRSMETMNITIDHVKATIVSMNQNKANHRNMHSTFRRVIEKEQRRRKMKVERFQQLRESFQDSVLTQSMETDYNANPNFKMDDTSLPSMEMEPVEDYKFTKPFPVQT